MNTHTHWQVRLQGPGMGSVLNGGWKLLYFLFYRKRFVLHFVVSDWRTELSETRISKSIFFFFLISVKEENVMLTFETKPTSNSLLYSPCGVVIVFQIKESFQQYITYVYFKLCLVPLCCFETRVCYLTLIAFLVPLPFF